MILNVLKIFGLSTFTFFLAFLATPVFAHYFYKYKMWKKKPRSDLENPVTDDFRKIHNGEEETNTPRLGGIIIWLSVFFVAILFWLFSVIFPVGFTTKLNFLSRGQTWVPLFVLIVSSFIGLIDDFLQIYPGAGQAGLSRKTRILAVLIIGVLAGWWFFSKLGMSSIPIPFLGELNLGILFIPVFMAVMFVIFSGSVIDGIDGLAGGVMASIFSAYAGIAYFQNQIDIATFCAVVTGGILAFLWFNIPPARFYMGETGMIGLTATLTVVAFLTKAVAVLPVIAFSLIAASGSSFLQIISKKYFGKKIFRVAPLPLHFKALGWPHYKVTMRFWVISVVFAIIGMVITLIG